MEAEYTTYDSYYDYLKTLHGDIDEYNEKLSEYNQKIDEIHNYIVENKFEIEEYLSIKIDKYQTEIANKTFNPNKTLQKLVVKIYKNYNEDEHKGLILQILKYCQYLERKHKVLELIKATKQRNKLTYTEYKNLLKKFYHKVHEHMLNGHGYKYQYGLGVFFINKKKFFDTGSPIYNLHKTKENLYKLLDQGITPYNKQDKYNADLMGIKYFGVDYKVPLFRDYWFGIDHLRSGIENLTKTHYVHQIRQTRSRNYRQMTYKEAADLYITKPEELYKFNTDIIQKVYILFYKFPEMGIYINRHVITSKYEYRKNYSENRQ